MISLDPKCICNVITHMARYLTKQEVNVELIDRLELLESYKLASK